MPRKRKSPRVVVRRVRKAYTRKRKAGFSISGIMNKIGIPAVVGIGTVLATNMMGNKDLDIANIPKNIGDPAKVLPLAIGIGASLMGYQKIGTALQSAGWVTLSDQAMGSVRTGDYIVTL